MTKFMVTTFEVLETEWLVDADNEEEAVEKVATFDPSVEKVEVVSTEWDDHAESYALEVQEK